jgi:hypothetical protein
MYLPPINGLISATDAEVLAEWHEEKATATSGEVQRRHEVIAFRLWKAAHRRRAADRLARAA